MAAELQVFDDDAGMISRQVAFSNLSNEALVSVALALDDAPDGGQAIADTYLLELEYDSGWLVQVSPEHGMPYAFGPANLSENVSPEIIPGLLIAFGLLNPALTYRSQIAVGVHFGTLVAGSNGTPVRLWARNIGDAAGVEGRVLVRPDARLRNLTEPPILRGVTENDLPPDLVTGTWTLELVNLDPFEIEASLNGSSQGVLPVAGGPPHNWRVELPGGPIVHLQELEYASVGAMGEVLISPGFLDFQLAADESGAPGAFHGSELELGSFDPDETKPFWVRAESAPGRSAEGNPYTALLQARILAV